tara:strand:- start:3306 stop:3584 length:279 start_codon:yes stop_codon:yes gene_type:complete
MDEAKIHRDVVARYNIKNFETRKIGDTTVTSIACGPCHVMHLYSSGYEFRVKRDELPGILDDRLKKILSEAPPDFNPFISRCELVKQIESSP